METKRYKLTESEWKRIKDMLPPEQPRQWKRGRPAKYDNRCIMNGILWIARTGAPWRTLPERYGKWQAVYARNRQWKQLKIFADMENLSIDSTSCKVHQSANGGGKR